MAGSLDQLVHLLVAEIASSGQEDGCKPTQILLFIDQFYAATSRENGQFNQVTGEASSNPKPAIDTSFQEQIWTLLTKHPNISVGKEGTFSYLPISDIEATDSSGPQPVTVSVHGTFELTDPTHGSADASLGRGDAPSIVEAVSVKGVAAQTSGDALLKLIAKSPERDQFDFPWRPQPALQYRDGQANLTDTLQVASPSGFKPSAGDLVAVENGSGKSSVELLRPHAPQENDDHCGACGGLGELICCDGCSNAFHGACLEPPVDTKDLSEDQWYCPQCETGGAQNATSQVSSRKISTTSANKRLITQMAAITPRSPTVKENSQTKPKGRPRKFLPGTEQFWRAQISTASKSFVSRPPDFDATLIQAINNGLPTPVDAADITQNWINETLAMLNRSANGVYISPRGKLHHGYRKHKTRSQVMIIKSARLREVDFSEGHAVAAVRFLTSSAAHTLPYLRFYPSAKTPAVLRLFESATSPAAATPQSPLRRKGPKLGIFHDEPYRYRSWRSPFFPVEASLRRMSGQSVSTIGSPTCPIESHSQSQTTSPQPSSATPSEAIPSPDHPEPGGFYGPSTRPPNGLPPPLTTRAASKRQASTQDALGRGNAGASQNTTTSATPRTIINTHEKTMIARGQARERQILDIDKGDARPKKRVKRNTTGLLRATTRQQIILDIVDRCGGAFPDNSLLLRRAFTAALHRSGESGQLDKRTVDAILKALYTAGKLKKSTFSFKDQRGFMVISSIMAKPELGPADPVTRQLQGKIAEVYPNQYIPPGMYAYNISQEEDNRGPQQGEPPQQRKKGAEPLGIEAQISSALQPIENKALAPIRDSGRTTGAKHIVSLEPLAGTALSQGRSDIGDATGPGSSSRALVGDMSENVTFLMRQQKPIVFDSQISSSLPAAGTKSVEKANRKVIWKKGPLSRPMPRSLEEILRDGTRRTRTENRLTERAPGLSRFESEVDCVARWEERSFNRFQESNESQDWNFISHVVGPNFEAVRMETVPVYFHGLTWYDESGKEKLYTPAELRRLQLSVLNTQYSLAGSTSSPAISQHPDVVGETLSPDTWEVDSSSTVGHLQGTPAKKRTRKPAKTKPVKRRKPTMGRRLRKTETEIEPAYINNPDGTVIDVSGYINAPVKRPRGAQHLRNMPEAAIYKLTVAIVVIRTLSGGLDKHIDWTLVTQIFPDEDADFIRDRWRTIKNKFRRDIAALTENLQDRFCDAYVEGEVPNLDFDDIYNNDWEGVVEWAVRNLDKGYVKGIEDLPDTREEVVEMKNMTFEEHRGMRELLGYNIGSSLPVREAAQASTVFAKPVESLRLQPPAFDADISKEDDEQVDIAKSWALATILTPEGNFDAHACKKKLSKLAKTTKASDALFDRVLKSMVGEKTIVRDREGYTGVASRGYNASKLFYDGFDARRTVQTTLLHQAARYKRDVLDPAFSAGQQVIFRPTSVKDGDMVAILNLLVNGRARVQIGPDVPKNRYGLLNADGTGTYQTRHLDKEKLSFTVLVEAIEGKYVSGNPMEMQVAPVPALGDYDKVAIPVWVDIHGNFQDELWELVICAVIGLISTRSGIDARELVKTLSPSLKLWETEIVLQWMQRCGFIKVSGEGNGQGWETTEWWWLICGGLNGWHLGNLS